MASMYPGSLGSGDDMDMESGFYLIKDAQNYALELEGCVGFCFEGDGDDGEEHECFFKTQWGYVEANGWTSVRRAPKVTESSARWCKPFQTLQTLSHEAQQALREIEVTECDRRSDHYTRTSRVRSAATCLNGRYSPTDQVHNSRPIWQATEWNPNDGEPCVLFFNSLWKRWVIYTSISKICGFMFSTLTEADTPPEGLWKNCKANGTRACRMRFVQIEDALPLTAQTPSERAPLEPISDAPSTPADRVLADDAPPLAAQTPSARAPLEPISDAPTTAANLALVAELREQLASMRRERDDAVTAKEKADAETIDEKDAVRRERDDAIADKERAEKELSDVVNAKEGVEKELSGDVTAKETAEKEVSDAVTAQTAAHVANALKRCYEDFIEDNEVANALKMARFRGA